MPRHTLFSSFNLSLPLHTTLNSSTGVSLLVRCFHYFFYNLDFKQIQTSLSYLPSSWQRKIMHCLHINPLLICTWFLISLVHEIDFWTWLLKLIFTACGACKNPVRNRQKIKFKNQVQINKRKVSLPVCTQTKRKEKIESTIASNYNHFVHLIGEFTWIFSSKSF